jgi:hypothetical protein
VARTERVTPRPASPSNSSQPALPPPPLPLLVVVEEAAVTVSVTELALDVPTELVHVSVYA